VRGLPAAPGIEPRRPGALFEHHGKCPLLAPQSLVQRHPGRPGDVRRLRVHLHSGQRLAGPSVRRALTAGVPAAVPGCQGGALPRGPDASKRPHPLARLIENPRAPHPIGGRDFPPGRAGHQIPPWPEDGGIGRETW
jgi:hypothetical protein